MRTGILTGFMLAACLPTAGMAGSLGMPEPQAMVYYQIPLGARPAESAHRFGFRVDEMFLDSNQPADFSRLLGRPAALEFEMDSGGIRTLSVAGYDYMQRFRASRQNDGSGDAPANAEGSGGDSGGAGSSGDQTEASAQTPPEKPKRTIQQILDNTEPGWLIGGAIGILILSGVAD